MLPKSSTRCVPRAYLRRRFRKASHSALSWANGILRRWSVRALLGTLEHSQEARCTMKACHRMYTIEPAGLSLSRHQVRTSLEAAYSSQQHNASSVSFGSHTIRIRPEHSRNRIIAQHIQPRPDIKHNTSMSPYLQPLPNPYSSVSATIFPSDLAFKLCNNTSTRSCTRGSMAVTSFTEKTLLIHRRFRAWSDRLVVCAIEGFPPATLG